MSVTLNSNFKGSGLTLSQDKLSIIFAAKGVFNFVRATVGVCKGKWYWEYKQNKPATGTAPGIVSEDARDPENSAVFYNEYPEYAHTLTAGSGVGYYAWNSKALYTNGMITRTGDIERPISEELGGVIPTYTNGDVIGFALNMDAGELSLYKNSVLVYTQKNIPNKTFYPAIAAEMDWGNNAECTFNFGATPFEATMPDGFKPYNSQEEQPAKCKSLLRVTMIDSSVRDYQLSTDEINGFVNWYTHHIGTDTTASCLTKKVGQQESKEYLTFDKIISFEVITI